MKKKTVIVVLVIIGVIAGIAGFSYYSYVQKISEEAKYTWVSSGPFAINKSQYKLSEYVFFAAQGLQPNEIGNATVVSPKGTIYTLISFNGTVKTHFNTYFKPNTGLEYKLYTPQDLVGNWTIIFTHTNYAPIHFQIINEWILGGQAEVQPVPQNLIEHPESAFKLNQTQH